MERLTRQCAVEGLLPRMAPHMRPQCIPTRMRNPLATAIAPLAAVLLLPRPNVVLVQMLDQVVHVLHIPRVAAVPLAHGDLVLPVVVFGTHARVVRRRGDGAVRVFGDVAVHGRQVVHCWRVGYGAHVEAWAFGRAARGLVVGGLLVGEAAAFDRVGEVVGRVVAEVRVGRVHCDSWIEQKARRRLGDR
jgi:hypothetical protein